MKILIFTASAGNGHNSTAKRIMEKVLEKNKDAEIEVVDAYKSYAGKLRAWIMEDGYFFACKYLTGIYNHFFKKQEKSIYKDRHKVGVNKSVYPLVYGMLKKIYEFKPDVIISTYVYCSVALTNIKRYYKLPARTICMTLDYGVSPYWEVCSDALDYMFLTGEYMIEPFKQRGYRDEQLIVSGVPVADKFSNLYEKKEARKMLGLEEDLFTITVMKASFFPISNRKLLKQFQKINDRIQIVIINGKDEKNKKDFDKRLKKLKTKHNIVNIGYTDKMVEYISASDLILGKGGGLSTTESINSGVPSLILDKLPQQEIYNREYLINNNCAVGITNSTIAENVNKLIADKSLCEELTNNTLKIRKTGTLDKIYEVIATAKKADYSGLELLDDKKTVIKNIHKKRMQAIKENNNKK